MLRGLAHETPLEPPPVHSPVRSGRQESNLPVTAYQTVASPIGLGPKKSALYGNRTRLTC